MVGRKKKPDAERKENRFQILMTQAERRAIDKAAKEDGMESSSWARLKLMQIIREAKKK